MPSVDWFASCRQYHEMLFLGPPPRENQFFIASIFFNLWKAIKFSGKIYISVVALDVAGEDLLLE